MVFYPLWDCILGRRTYGMVWGLTWGAKTWGTDGGISSVTRVRDSEAWGINISSLDSEV